jgi:hypothetical protein
MWGSNPQPPAKVFIYMFAVTGESNPVVFPKRKLPAAADFIFSNIAYNVVCKKCVRCKIGLDIKLQLNRKIC